MTTLYLHGGMQKTGTTAIQHFLASNREALEQQGAVYPDFSDLYDWIHNKRNAHWLLHQKYNETKLAATIERIGALSEKYTKIILSDEQLWNNKLWNPEFWVFFKDLLAPYDITVKYVVYLRRQDLYLYSNWAQSIKSMIDVPFKTYSFSRYIEEGCHSKQHLDYGKILDDITPVLGEENILVRVYERDQLLDGSITSDFLHTVGLDVNAAYQEPEKVTNVSLKDSVLETKRYLNQLPGFVRTEHRSGDPYCANLLHVQEEMQKEGLLQERTGFSNAERRTLMLQYEEGNAQVARRYLGRVDGVLFYEQIPDDEDEQQTYTTEELIEVCGRVILRMQEKIDNQAETNRELRQENAGLRREIEELKKRTEPHESGRRLFGRK